MEYRVSWTIMDDRELAWILTEYNGLWTMVDYHGLWTIMDYHGLKGLIMDYGLSWSIVDYCGTLCIIVDSYICTAMESHGLPDMHPKPLPTPKRYGAGMAHTVASIGVVLSCSHCRLLWTTMDYRLSWTFMDHAGLS